MQTSIVCMAARGLTGTQGLLDKKRLMHFFTSGLELHVWCVDFYTAEKGVTGALDFWIKKGLMKPIFF